MREVEYETAKQTNNNRFFFIESFIVGLYGFTEKNLLTFKK